MSASPVVVGVDFSTSSLEAARWSARHLERDAPMVLAHAIYIPAPPRFLAGMYPPLQPILDDARRGADERLTELGLALDRSFEAEVRAGRPEEVLNAIARGRDARLLVVGAHGQRSGMWRLLGSTAERVVRQMPCSVLLARALPAGEIRTTLVAIDESELTTAALAEAARVSGGDPSGTVLLHVISGALTGAVQIGASPSEARAAMGRLTEQTERWLHDRAREAGLEGARCIAASGDAGMEILRAAERHGADLVVIGPHGAGHGMFLGSTAEFVLRQGTGPVLVVSGSRPGGMARDSG